MLVERLIASGAITSPVVERAFLTVPRHLFVPPAEADSAYLDHPLVVKCGGDGRPVSTASQPTMMAHMLDQLGVEGGNRILEIGTGTGYNAALLREIAGPTGSVVTVEIEPDIAVDARRSLEAAGYGDVEVIAGDGRQGHPSRAPYHRIMVTGGASVVADAWTAQLAEGGRLVVPIVDEHGEGASVVFDKTEGSLVRREERPCRFVLLRGPHTG
jgi:protein-L-isoaspartate(D-aspartate) O-methyltransferase